MSIMWRLSIRIIKKQFHFVINKRFPQSLFIVNKFTQAFVFYFNIFICCSWFFLICIWHLLPLTPPTLLCVLKQNKPCQLSPSEDVQNISSDHFLCYIRESLSSHVLFSLTLNPGHLAVSWSHSFPQTISFYSGRPQQKHWDCPSNSWQYHWYCICLIL